MTEYGQDLLAYLVHASSRTELPVSLRYRADDPFAVTATIGTDRVDWTWSRELLRAGISCPAGMGDVHVWPGGEVPDDHLFVYLRSPRGQALLELSRAAVLDFLHETEILAPTGIESSLLSLDAELQELTDGYSS
jgi:Streptomyces sporulation and cell division protein, SsgA